jgi:hypothetical protein
LIDCEEDRALRGAHRDAERGQIVRLSLCLACGSIRQCAQSWPPRR